MHPKVPTTMLVLIVLLTVAAVLALMAQPPAPGRDFQQLVGGLGFGPVVDLDGCGFAFDPRLCPTCAQNLGPIPGGKYFCPHHAGSILDYPPLRPHSGD